MIAQDILAAAVAHAKECAYATPPRESCGLVVRAGKKARYLPCQNLADQNPSPSTDDFAIGKADWQAARASGEIVMVVHSHFRCGPQPSPADVSGCETSGLPWLIVTPSGAHHYFEPCGAVVPLLGRPYVYGVHDCATLVRDWLAINHNIRIEIMPSEDGWWLTGANLLVEHVQAQGFRRVALDSLQLGDVLFIQAEGPCPHHCAIWLGNGHILHHLRDRVSREDVYGDHWRTRTRSAWRHQDLEALCAP